MEQMEGQLVKLTYEGLPLEYEEWDDLYIVGNIPPDIWDTIRKRHEEYMRDPDWMVDELTNITVETLEAAGLKVYTFSGSSEFPALRNILCDWCRCQITDGDRSVQYKDAPYITSIMVAADDPLAKLAWENLDEIADRVHNNQQYDDALDLAITEEWEKFLEERK